MTTISGRELARERFAFMEAFFSRLKLEVGGEL
jgi:hypothetical protein